MTDSTSNHYQMDLSSATITKPGQKLIQFGAITGSAKENPTDFESPEI